MFELLLITDPAARSGIAGSVSAALEGAPGERVAVQLRAKDLPAAELASTARVLREHTRRAGALLIVNGSLDLAREVGADGVHLPEGGPSPSEARDRLGPAAIIGVSCHAPARLALAADGGATFATLSPVYASPGKGAPLGVTRFAAWTRAGTLPVFALGGVTAANVNELRRAGASGLAVISAVFGSADPARAVRELLAAWDHFPAT